MKIALAILIFMLSGCAHERVRYTPRLPCPDLPELAENATRAELEQHDLTVVTMYGECRKARRVNPRIEKGAQS